MSKTLTTIKSSVQVILRNLLDNQRACVVIYTEPCKKHDVYTVGVVPWGEYQFQLNLGQMIGVFSQDDEDDSKTYIRSLVTVAAGTSLRYRYRGVKCQLTVWHVGGAMLQLIPGGCLTYTYYEGKLKSQDMTEPPKPEELPPGLMLQQQQEAKKPKQQLKEQTGQLVNEHLDQLTTTLYLLVTLLGGQADVVQMEKLNRRELSEAFQYLRIAYRKKFFNAKEKTGKRPACLRECFVA